MNKTALITGTTSGIGYALCEKFAREKTDLVLVSRNPGKLAEQKDYLQNTYGITAWVICQNLEQPGAARNVYKEICELRIDIDFLVQNAGFNEVGKFIETDIEKEKSMIQLHIVFITELTKLILKDMSARGSGKILFIGSTGSLIPCPLDAVYAATKAYILFFSKALRAELKGTGITATTICPGSTQTNFAEKAGIQETLLFKKNLMMPDKVADAGYDSMMKGKSMHIPGIYTKFLIFLSRIMPAAITDSLAIKMLTREV